MKGLLLEQDNKIRQLQEDLSKKKKEEVDFMQWMIEYIIGEIERLVKGSEEIRGDDKKVILQVMQKISSVLEEEVARCLPDETSHAAEDLGYISRCSTPVGRY
ncbi:hypothetical protein HET73_05390 [Wolbachia endosymbiont of Atemnus politus]|uniref:hypothetical protein n=1 Tax=Wolbachia endosymbiont of Atemnus politus TaxID=2682840 RepID=UPI0015728ADA|nr:hypothetical protein [Wolbachia endosymbiont of Atemnus politus]NSM56807.1 hypothetical protein [Wolbachia endosymbiont of Atemnus politus]